MQSGLDATNRKSTLNIVGEVGRTAMRRHTCNSNLDIKAAFDTTTAGTASAPQAAGNAPAAKAQ
jgi:hypothetical protein